MPRGARYCPSCGAAVQSGDTVRADVPPHETTASPVRIEHTSIRWFGVTPAVVVFGLAVAALVLALVLLATTNWVAGLLLLGLALLFFAAFLEVARRKPDSDVVKRAAEAADSVRARAGFAAQAFRTRSSARKEITRRRAELLRLAEERELLLRVLGDAVYRGEDGAPARDRIEVLDERARALEAEAAAIADQARARVERAALEVQPTEVAEPENDA